MREEGLNHEESIVSENEIKLFILDRDPIFRLGLSTALANYSQFQIILEAETTEDIVEGLNRAIIPDIVIIGWSLDNFLTPTNSCSQICQQLLKNYSQLMILVVASGLKSQELSQIQGLGVRGYCFKGTNIESLVFALNCILQGEIYWQQNQTSDTNPNLWQTTLSRIGRSGQQQIDIDLENIENRLQDETLSLFNRLLLFGRKRELQTSRWLVNRLGVPESNLTSETSELSQTELATSDSQLLPQPSRAIADFLTDSVTSRIFNRVFNDIRIGAINNNKFCLEIDILQSEKRKVLLHFILEIFVDIVNNLDQNQDLLPQIELGLRSIWLQVTNRFFFEHYQETIVIDSEQFRELLGQEYAQFCENILSKIYFAPELCGYLAWEYPLIIDQVTYRVDSPEAISRAINLLHNLLIQIANGTMQVILNNFSDLETFKYNLYLKNYRSSRAIASFRNEISWRYRLEKYWETPKDIFESSYQILTLHNGKIIPLPIYAPRTQELYELTGLPWLTTIILELRDAIAPRLRSVLALVGNGLVFTLTNIIGKGIGLIGKGIIQGLGNTLKK